VNYKLAPNPSGCRSLRDPEVARLRQQYPGLWANPAKTCLTCDKKGEFLTRRNGEVITVTCDCLAQWKLHRWMLNAGVDEHYQRLSWEDVIGVPDSVQVEVMDYLEGASANLSQGHGLTLWSPDRGTGKTLLASLVLKRLLADGHDGYFTQFNLMLDFFTATWRSEEERSWFTRKVRNVGVLVVDDIGRENKGRDAVSEAMFDTVIRARVAGSRPTIITTNYNPEQLLQGYGPNVLSLLSEVNIAIELPGADFRPRQHEQTRQDIASGLVRPLVVA
jgi:DNA replication protein DnaC